MKNEFVIDRSKWRCGNYGPNAVGFGDTELLNEEGYMCCLGQIACQLKWPKEVIRYQGEPSECDIEDKKVNKSILTREIGGYSKIIANSEFANEAIDINDNEDTTVKEKEKALKELAKEHGLKIKFVGKATKYKDEECYV